MVPWGIFGRLQPIICPLDRIHTRIEIPNLIEKCAVNLKIATKLLAPIL